MEDNYWNDFLKSGSVEDYLKYKMIKEQEFADESEYNYGTYYQGTEGRRE